MIALIGEVCSNALDAPYEVCICIRSIEADASRHRSEEADIGMPWMRYGAVLIFGKEAEYGRSIDAWEGIRQVNDHLETLGIDRLVAHSGLVEPLNIRNATDAMYVIFHLVADRQSFGIRTFDTPLDVRTCTQPFLHLLPFMQQTPIPASEWFIPEMGLG